MFSVVAGYLLPFIGMMGALIAIHEAGHFLAARLLGIEVTDFAIGMGPTLLRFTDRSGCVWRLCALPLGGYVKMRGDDHAVTEGPERNMFRNRPVWHRACVVIAGPLANVLAGFAVLVSLYVGIGQAVLHPVIATVVAGSPASSSGLQAGDRILSIDGRVIGSFSDIVDAIAPKAGSPTVLTVQRADDRITLNVTPTAAGADHKGRIGITGSPSFEPMSLPGAAMKSAGDVGQMTTSALHALWETVTLKRPLSDMGGPVKIAEVSHDTIKFGWLAFVTLGAVLSVNLAVMNLMPVPVLDGGHLMLLAWETIRGKPPTPAVALRLFRGGAIALLIVFIAVSSSDIAGLVGRMTEH